MATQLEACVADARLYKKWKEEYMTLEMKMQECKDRGRIEVLCDLVKSGVLAISQAVDAGKKYGIQDEADFFKKAASAGYTFKKD